jgi:hypothetical protein
MNNQTVSVNPEDLKETANTIRKCIIDLKDAKKLADSAWEDCLGSISMGEQFINILNDNKMSNDKTFANAINKLETRANSLESISNIWKDSETEIMASVKSFNDMFSLISKKISDISNNRINKE